MMLAGKYIKLALLTCILSVMALVYSYTDKAELPQTIIKMDESASEVAAYIKQQVAEQELPGVAAVVLDGGEIVYQGLLGFSNTQTGVPLSPDSRFELASNTKAFTGLAVHHLVQQGKIELAQNIDVYLDDMLLTFNGHAVQVTVRDLLYHTSGIGSDTLSLIRVSNSPDALSTLVADVKGMSLKHLPSSTFEYATINYDLLGAIIEQVTSQRFEQYVETQILQPLGLVNTDFSSDQLASGHSFYLGSAEPYQAPYYRANAPAAYLSSNISDITLWLELLIGQKALPESLRAIFAASLAPNRQVLPSATGGSYASGWWLIQSGAGRFEHSGSNPAFGSFIMFEPNKSRAIAVLTNINSTNAEDIARGIDSVLNGVLPVQLEADQYRNVDNVATIVLIFTLPFAVLCFTFLCIAIKQAIQGHRQLVGSPLGVLNKLLVSLVFMAGLAICLYTIPQLFFSGVTWEVVSVWAPASFIPALITIQIAAVSFILYLIFTMSWRAQGDKQIFANATLGAISGLGNTLCIFTINMAIHMDDPLANQSYIIFFFGMILYVAGQKIVRTQVLNITHKTVYEMRINMVRKILRSPYFKMEKVEKEKIQTVLNNDAELISQFPHFLISIITSATTLFFCFIYLGTVNLTGLLLALGVVFVAITMFFIAGMRVNTYIEKARTIQEHFFHFINDLISGLKELNLNEGKSRDFNKDMEASCQEYRESNVKSGVKFVNVLVMGELLFTVVVGVVAFIYPVLFSNLSAADITTFVLVFLYMTGPVNGILQNIPQIMQIKVAWGRASQFSNYLNELENKAHIQAALETKSAKSIRLSDVTYSYQIQDSTGQRQSFVLGPINFEFKGGEITFITGGNGSGKSTLAKIITGLYRPDEGTVSVDGQVVSSEQLSALYTAIFCDYHLFKKIYGVEAGHKQSEIEAHLEALGLTGIVSIDSGVVSSTKLSTGQRKRLALLVSHLDERPVYLFDEWAADQDPKFRKVFYEGILPELKRQNKLVIVISHDDHYFHVADTIIKMEMGKMLLLDKEELHA
ncbi:cyclic peptide export ABC transporter [Pseudoalteromonas holothuriae]|nr:cyclic peptide export ABC transporter [Pseudoalteromonas sp. CIP111854]